jgi:hypothetical protein
VLVQSPKSDIFVVLLSVALGAIVISVLMMVKILANYEFKTKAAALPVASQVASVA